MKKTFAKIIIVLCLAFGIGRGLVHYTTRGADYYEIAKKEIRSALLDVLDAEDKNSDLAPYLQTPAEELSGLYNSGIVIGSGTVDSATIQERLEYYQSSKVELW